MEGIPKEVEINLSRLAYQWEKSINAAIEEMRVQAINYIHEELATIDALISGTKGQTEDIRKLIAQIRKIFYVIFIIIRSFTEALCCLSGVKSKRRKLWKR